MDRQYRVAGEGLRIHVVDSERRLRDLLRALQTSTKVSEGPLRGCVNISRTTREDLQ